MRYTALLFPLLATSLAIDSKKQNPIVDRPNLGPAMPPPPPPSSSSPRPGADSDTVILSDVLQNTRSINIFAGFTRDFANISQRFEDSSLNTTILAPINSAIMALPRKPWEDPAEYERLGAQAYEGDEGEDRAKENIRKFVEEHVVGVSPWKEREKVETLGGGKIWWEMKDGARFIQPGDIEVDSIASKVYNGEVWILKGVRNYT